MSTVFISYRRNDKFIAFTLHDRLRNKSLDVFIDEKINPGEDFRERIAKEIERCDVMLAVIGQGWVNQMDRLKEIDDFVRREITLAMSWKKPVIPVVMEGGRIPKLNELPDELHAILNRHAQEIRANDQAKDFNRLARAIHNLVKQSADEQIWVTTNGLRGVLNLALGAVSGIIVSPNDIKRIAALLAPSLFQENELPKILNNKGNYSGRVDNGVPILEPIFFTKHCGNRL